MRMSVKLIILVYVATITMNILIQRKWFKIVHQKGPIFRNSTLHLTQLFILLSLKNHGSRLCCFLFFMVPFTTFTAVHHLHSTEFCKSANAKHSDIY